MSLRSLDLNLLILFEAIYTSGSVTAASKRLNLSQPAVSNGLSRLRYQVDDQLFIRSGQGVVPTCRAREMITRVREALRLLGVTEDKTPEFDPYTAQRVFRIIDPMESIPVAALIDQLRKYPGIRLEILPNFDIDIKGEFGKGAVDLACHVCPLQSEVFHVKKLYNMDCVVITRKDHPALANGLDVENFQRLSHLTLVSSLQAQGHVDEQFLANDIHWQSTCAVTEFRRMPETVAQCDLAAVVPTQVAVRALDHYDLDIHQPPFALPKRPIFSIWQRNSKDDAGLRWLEALIGDLILKEQNDLPELLDAHVGEPHKQLRVHAPVLEVV